MTFKHLLFSLSLMSISISMTPLLAASKNGCDVMEEKLEQNREDYSEKKIAEEKANIKKCRATLGESPYYKEKMKKLQKDDARAQKEQEEEARRNENLITKEFSEEQLKEAGFGKPFFAKKINYGRNGQTKEEILTEGEALCKYLGYKKSSKTVISSEEIVPTDAYQNGWTVDVNWFTGKAKQPEIFDPKKVDYTVKKFSSITCVKSKFEGPRGDEDLKRVVEIVVEASAPIKDSDDSEAIDSGPKAGNGKKIKGPCETTEHGYVREGCGD